MNVSVLIPVYNYDIRPLVEKLYEQLKAHTDSFEILMIDDCSMLSTSYLNMKTAQKDNVKYEVRSTNIGRAAIRNRLFNRAAYDFCICMDCDMMLENDDYIKNYINAYAENSILVGGHYYQKERPIDSRKLLHWLYGTDVEVRSLRDRKDNPYKSFMSSNFACTKKTFSQLQFDESIQGYGHEDTLFGIKAKENNIKIKHIKNPLKHEGLHDVSTFLAHQKNAVKNLKHLYKTSPYSKQIKRYSKLIKTAEKPLLPYLTKSFETTFLTNLKSNSPRLMSLQMMKVIWWHKF